MSFVSTCTGNSHTSASLSPDILSKHYVFTFVAADQRLIRCTNGTVTGIFKFEDNTGVKALHMLDGDQLLVAAFNTQKQKGTIIRMVKVFLVMSNHYSIRVKYGLDIKCPWSTVLGYLNFSHKSYFIINTLFYSIVIRQVLDH